MSLVSVIMPCYNVDKYVALSLDSLLTQTYQNLEILCVDDGSTDNTQKVLLEYAQKDERIVVLVNEENLGICQSLNKGLAIAKGKYISRTDSDDISKPNRIESQLNFLKRNPNIDLVCHNVDLIDFIGNRIGQSKQYIEHDKIKKAMKWRSSVFHFWLARKSFYDTVGDYRFDGVEDYDLLLRGISKGCIYANLPESLYCYRVRQGSSAFVNGVFRVKMRKYVYELHRWRESDGNIPYPTFPVVTKLDEHRYNYALTLLVKVRSLSSGFIMVLVANIIPLIIYPEVFITEHYNSIRYRLMK